MICHINIMHSQVNAHRQAGAASIHHQHIAALQCRDKHTAVLRYLLVR